MCSKVFYSQLFFSRHLTYLMFYYHSSPSCSPPPFFLTSPPIGPGLLSARPEGLFPVCPGAGGNLSRETDCLVAASCEHLAQLGTQSRVRPPETECGHLHTQTRGRAQVHTLHTLVPALPSALYNYGPQGNVM